MTAGQLKAFIAEYTEEVWNRRKVDTMDRYYSPRYVHHDLSRPDVRSLADYKQWARDLQAGIGNLHVAADDLIGEESSKAVKRWTVSGVHSGTLAGLAPTGKQVKFSGMSAYRIEEGRIVESWYVYDLLGLLQQLGALPSPG
jgi:steroid delta-isomerase-like uncharacterized protein